MRLPPRLLLRTAYTAVLALLLSGSAWARSSALGYCSQGGVTLVLNTGGFTSAPKAQASYPGCTVTVYLSGSTTIASIYDSGGSARANPFTADATTGLWLFYADNAAYDVKLSGGGIPTPFTLSHYTLYEAPAPIWSIDSFSNVTLANSSYTVSSLTIKDQTPSTGASKLILRAGAAQPTYVSSMMEMYDSTGSQVGYVSAIGDIGGYSIGITNQTAQINPTGMNFGTGRCVIWSSAVQWFNGTPDTSVCRESPSVLVIGNAVGSRGDIHARNLVLDGTCTGCPGLVSSVFGQTGVVNIPVTTTDITTPIAPAAGTTTWYSKGGVLCAISPASVETCLNTPPTNVMTTNTTQTGLTGNKTSSGTYALGGLTSPTATITNLTVTTCTGCTGAGGYATIQEEGSSLTQRATLNFIGSSVACVDDSGNSRTNCTVTGGGGGTVVPYGVTFSSGATTGNVVHNYGTLDHVVSCTDTDLRYVFPTTITVGLNTDVLAFTTGLVADTRCVASVSIQGSGGGGGGAPFSDSLTMFYNQADPTKTVKVNLAAIATGTNRTFTYPDKDMILAGINVTQTFTANQTYNAHLIGNGTVDVGMAVAGQYFANGRFSTAVVSQDFRVINGNPATINSYFDWLMPTTTLLRLRDSAGAPVINMLGVGASDYQFTFAGSLYSLNGDIQNDLGSQADRWRAVNGNTISAWASSSGTQRWTSSGVLLVGVDAAGLSNVILSTAGTGLFQSTLGVVGDATMSNIYPSADSTKNLGSQTARWGPVGATQFNAYAGTSGTQGIFMSSLLLTATDASAVTQFLLNGVSGAGNFRGAITSGAVANPGYQLYVNGGTLPTFDFVGAPTGTQTLGTAQNTSEGTVLSLISASTTPGFANLSLQNATRTVAYICFTSVACLYGGSGTPEGAVIGGIGSLYLRSDGGAGTSLYVKQSGTGNVGWIGK